MTPEIKQRIEQIRRGEVPEGNVRTKAGIMPTDWGVGIKAKDVFRNSAVKHQGKDLTVLSATQDRGIVPRSEVDIDIKYDENNIDSYKKVEKGDFIISLRSFQGGIELSNYEGVVSPAYTILKNKKLIDVGYYKRYFKTGDFINRLNSAIYGIRDGKQIGYEDFGDLIIHYPPLGEQKKIAQVLDVCDRAIELKQKLIDELKKLKRACLAKMFPQEGETVPEIRFPRFTAPWEKRMLRDEFARRSERNDGSFEKQHWISVAKMYYQSADKVQSNNIDTRTYIMRKGDIAFEGHSNADFKYGRFVVNDIGDGIISELFPIYRHLGEFDIAYWKVAIQKEDIMAPIIAKAITTSGASANKLNEEHFLRQFIFVPSMPEQVVIGKFFSCLDSVISLYQNQLKQEIQKKKAIMQLLLTGIVRVNQ